MHFMNFLDNRLILMHRSEDFNRIKAGKNLAKDGTAKQVDTYNEGNHYYHAHRAIDGVTSGRLALIFFQGIVLVYNNKLYSVSIRDDVEKLLPYMKTSLMVMKNLH